MIIIVRHGTTQLTGGWRQATNYPAHLTPARGGEVNQVAGNGTVRVKKDFEEGELRNYIMI